MWIYSHEYWTHNFCKDCETWNQLFDQWKSEPKQIEHKKKYESERIESLLKKSKVSSRFKEKRLHDLKDNKGLLWICQKYCDNWFEMKNKWWWLYLWWNVGAWKTHAATAICNELIERYFVKVMFVNIGEIASRVKNTFDNKSNKEDSQLFEEIKNVELLVIDDIGVEKQSDWLAEQMFLIINHRYEKRMPVIITSNQSLEDLSKMHRPQICSRMQEMCKIIQFKWDDRRKNLRPEF